MKSPGSKIPCLINFFQEKLSGETMRSLGVFCTLLEEEKKPHQAYKLKGSGWFHNTLRNTALLKFYSFLLSYQ